MKVYFLLNHNFGKGALRRLPDATVKIYDIRYNIVGVTASDSEGQWYNSIPVELGRYYIHFQKPGEEEKVEVLLTHETAKLAETLPLQVQEGNTNRGPQKGLAHAIDAAIINIFCPQNNKSTERRNLTNAAVEKSEITPLQGRDIARGPQKGLAHAIDEAIMKQINNIFCPRESERNSSTDEIVSKIITSAMKTIAFGLVTNLVLPGSGILPTIVKGASKGMAVKGAASVARMLLR